jgi:hypothetical protein
VTDEGRGSKENATSLKPMGAVKKILATDLFSSTTGSLALVNGNNDDIGDLNSAFVWYACLRVATARSAALEHKDTHVKDWDLSIFWNAIGLKRKDSFK